MSVNSCINAKLLKGLKLFTPRHLYYPKFFELFLVKLIKIEGLFYCLNLIINLKLKQQDYQLELLEKLFNISLQYKWLMLH